MKFERVKADKYWFIVATFALISTLIIFHEWRLVFFKKYQQGLIAEGIFDDTDVKSLQPRSCVCRETDDRSTPVTLSTCSSDADRRGSNQSVVSYTLFGRPSDDETVRRRYFSSIHSKVNRVRQLYPGWIMRIYHNLTNSQEAEYLCPLQCQNGQQVDLCNVKRIRTDEINSALIQRLNPRMWRFLVMLDPLVDRFLSRDIDSEIITREVAAVNQWLDSNYTFHVMRDHPSHGGFMLAGLWGAKNVQRRELIRRLGKAMMWTSQNDHYQTDQARLDLIVWPFATFDVMAHDSYFCNNWLLKMSAQVPVYPFPTRRIGHNYTGLDLVRTDIADHITTCPYECRPANHKDWLLC